MRVALWAGNHVMKQPSSLNFDMEEETNHFNSHQFVSWVVHTRPTLLKLMNSVLENM